MAASLAKVKKEISGSIPKKLHPTSFTSFGSALLIWTRRATSRSSPFLARTRSTKLLPNIPATNKSVYCKKDWLRRLPFLFMVRFITKMRCVLQSCYLAKTRLQIIASLDANELSGALHGVPAIELRAGEISAQKPDLVTFLAASSIFASKGEARKMVLGGGVSLNKEKCTDVALQITPENFINGQFLFVQKGKTNYYLIKLV